MKTVQYTITPRPLRGKPANYTSIWYYEERGDVTQVEVGFKDRPQM